MSPGLRHYFLQGPVIAEDLQLLDQSNWDGPSREPAAEIQNPHLMSLLSPNLQAFLRDLQSESEVLRPGQSRPAVKMNSSNIETKLFELFKPGGYFSWREQIVAEFVRKGCCKLLRMELRDRYSPKDLTFRVDRLDLMQFFQRVRCCQVHLLIPRVF